MIARLTNQYIYFDTITVWEEELVVDRFSAENPNSRYIDSSSYQCWDGVYRKYSKKHKRLARPFLAELRLLAQKKDMSLTIIDERGPAEYEPIPIEEITPDFLAGITLKEFQVGAIRKLCVTECGVISITTGGGKTEIMAAMCKVMNCPTAIIAEQVVVIDQIRDRLDLRGVCGEPGLFYAGKMPNGELIIIGSIQSLVLPKNKPAKPLKENYKDTKSSTAQQKFKQAQKRYAASLKGYTSRTKKARALHKLISKCEMILVDECVDKDTLVNSSVGTISAGDLSDLIDDGAKVQAIVGMRAYDISGTSRITTDAHTLTTSTGRQLICSSNHLCATFTDGRRVDKYLSDLKRGDLVLSPRHCVSETPEIDYRWYDLGLFIGDGHKQNNTQVKFGVRRDRSDWIKWGQNASHRWSGSFTHSTNRRGDLVLRLKSTRFCKWLGDLGFTPGRKMGSIDPKFVVPSRAATAGLLRGLFDSEGSAAAGRALFSSTDLPLIRFVQVLLSYLGIGSSTGISRKGSGRHKTCWIVRVTGENFVRFTKTVSFGFSRKIDNTYTNVKNSDRLIDPAPYLTKWLGSGIKSGKLAKALGWRDLSSIRGLISLSRLISWQKSVLDLARFELNNYGEAKEALGISYDKISKYTDVSTMTVYNRIRDGSNIWKLASDSIQSKLAEPIVDLEMEHYGVESVISIDSAGVRDLIDFQVDGIKSFEANGLLVHNCDLAVGNTYKSLFRHWFKGRRRYGFTGTPYDEYKPVQRLVLNEHLGSVIYQQNRTQVEDTGLIVPLEYYMFAFGEDENPKDAAAYDIALDGWMVYNEEFHRLIKSICDKYPDDGTLILVERHDIGHALNDLIPDSQFVYGETPKKRRPEMLKAFERRDKKVLIGGKNVRRGLDLSGGCENLILATGGKLVSEFDQRLGRARRQNTRGKARVFDFLFLCNKYLYAHSRNRLKAAIGMGYKTHVVFRNGIIDGEKFVKSRFHRPRFPACSKTG